MASRPWPGLAPLVLAAAVCPAVAIPQDADDWIRVDSEHFTIVGNAGKRRTVAVVSKLERLREVLDSTSAMTLHSPLPTTIYVFKNEDSFAPYNLGPDGQPNQVGGYFAGTADGNYVAIDASAEPGPLPIIFHEYLHYILNNSVPNIPTWLDEGLAEFYSSFRIRGGKAEIGVAIEHHLRWLSTHPRMPLEELFAIHPRSRDYNEGLRQGTFYAQSWALIHYLLAGNEEMRGKFSRLLGFISDGADSREAVEAAFGKTLGTLQKELDAYIRSGSYGIYRYTPSEEFDEHAARVRPLPRKRLLFLLGDLLVHHAPVQFADAKAHLDAALTVDPEMAEPYMALAMMKLQQAKYDEAAELSARALKLAPDSGRARALSGFSLLGQFQQQLAGDEVPTDGTPPLLLRARTEFRRSVELLPDHAESLIGLGRTYLFETGDVDEGLQAMTRALKILPGRTDVLASLIVLTVRSGNRAGARSLLDRALRRNGTPEQIRLAESAIVTADVERAAALLEDGKLDEGRRLLRLAEEEASDPRIKALVVSILEEADAVTVEAGVVDLFNRGIDLANGGDLDGALELFGQVVDRAGRQSIGLAAQGHIDDIRDLRRRNRLIELYNTAVEKAGGGDLAGAASLLEEILENDPGPEMKANVERFLDDLPDSTAAER